MAFTTITGASGAPTTYTGTDGVDLITLVNPGATDLRADAENDFIGVNFTSATGTATNVSLRGGQGTDRFQFTGAAGGTLISSFIAGNQGDDQMFTLGTASLFTGSTVQGGQGNDAINIGGSNGGTLINGNRANDTITLAAAGTFTSSSIFGGQGNDTITVGANGNLNTTLAGVSIDGALGNDTITINDLAAASVNITVSGGAGQDIINASAQSTTTVGLFIDGGLGIDNIQGGDGADTILGGEGVDLIEGNLGNDLITLGAGQDTYVQAADSTAATRITNATVGAALTSGASFLTFGNGVDVITDFTSSAAGFTNDKLDAAVITNLGQLDTETALVVGDAYAMQGIWNSSLNTFTYNLTGSDMLYFVAATGTGINVAANYGTSSVVLVGAATDWNLTNNII